MGYYQYQLPPASRLIAFGHFRLQKQMPYPAKVNFLVQKLINLMSAGVAHPTTSCNYSLSYLIVLYVLDEAEVMFLPVEL